VARISELEGVVLGIVQARQPCTAYAVRREIQASASAHWGASAGAIYPLLARLESARWVESLVDVDDRRGRRMIRITASGRRALREWMLNTESAEVAANVSDAVRSRAFFLGSLSPASRRRFVDASLTALEAFLESAREDLAARSAADDFSRLAAQGGVYQAEARVRWMKEIRAYLEARGE
jgi:DNA-binding PadR family transcriptional regulator